MSDKSEKKQSATIIDAGLGEIDKIRGILFGRQMDAYEQRFAQIEQSLEKSLEAMQQSMKQQVENLQQAVDTSVEKLNQALHKESLERSDVFASLESGLTNSIQQTEKSLSQSLLAAEDQSQQELIELKMLVEKQNNSTGENIDELRAELVQMFQQQADALENNKVDRESLAMMLDEITLRLRKQPK
ncbi:MAG: hypothetical protein ACRBHB_00525 [Arenicella sp.]